MNAKAAKSKTRRGGGAKRSENAEAAEGAEIAEVFLALFILRVLCALRG